MSRTPSRLSYYEDNLPLEGMETYICSVCDESYVSYRHRNACEVVAKIKKWAQEGTLLDNCTLGTPPPINNISL